MVKVLKRVVDKKCYMLRLLFDHYAKRLQQVLEGSPQTFKLHQLQDTMYHRVSWLFGSCYILLFGLCSRRSAALEAMEVGASGLCGTVQRSTRGSKFKWHCSLSKLDP